MLGRRPATANRAGRLLALFLSFLSGCLRAAPETPREDLLLGELVDDYFSARFEFYPPEATLAGSHDFDAELGSLSGDAVRRRLDGLRDLRQRLTGVDLTALSREAYFDALQLSFAVRAELHDLEGIETWRRSPAFYCELLARGVASLVGPEFAPAHPRLTRLVTRLHRFPALTEAASRNLDRAPRIQIEVGLERLEQIEWALGALPKAFTEVTDQALLAELARANEEATRAVGTFRGRLTEALAGAPTAFALGKENLRLLLLYGEMEDWELDELRDLGRQEMRERAEELKRAAMALDPARPAAALLEEMGKSHPSPEEVIPFTEKALADLHAFLARRSLVSLPTGELVPVMAAPPFALARLPVTLEPDRPGGEPISPRLLVSVPELGWAPDRVEQQLRLMSRAALILGAASEVYPGRHLRLASLKRAPTRLRRLLASSSNLEGWTRYAERLMIEEGYAADEPGVQLVALHQELIAFARLVAVVGLHTESLTLAEAQSFFSREAYLDRAAAASEARDAAAFPDRLLPALGDLRIAGLRRDFLRAREAVDGLRAFHDAFLGCGAPPFRLVRLMLFPAEQRVGFPDRASTAER